VIPHRRRRPIALAEAEPTRVRDVDPGLYTAWVDCRGAPAAPSGSESQGFCTCRLADAHATNTRPEAERLVALHLRNARRRALALPLGDLEPDAIRRAISRTAELVRDIGVSPNTALTQARAEEVDGDLTGQLIFGPTSPSSPGTPLP
jgi:hypothetical protein